MITPNDILDKLEKLVREKFPGEEVYTNLTPTDFQRPSTLIQLESCEGAVGYGCSIIEMRPVVKLTTFVPVDDYHHSHLAALHLRQMILVGLFLPGYIRVGDRAVKVAMEDQGGRTGRIELGGGWDYDTVTVPLVYTLDRSDFENIPQLPLMEELHIRQEVNTYG